MILTIMETRPKDSGTGAGKSREEIVQEKARELKAKLPEGKKLFQNLNFIN